MVFLFVEQLIVYRFAGCGHYTSKEGNQQRDENIFPSFPGCE